MADADAKPGSAQKTAEHLAGEKALSHGPAAREALANGDVLGFAKEAAVSSVQAGTHFAGEIAAEPVRSFRDFVKNARGAISR